MAQPSWVILQGMARSFIELYKSLLHDKAVMDGGAFECITMNKASGCDGIPGALLFQILKDDAVKVLYTTCSKFGKQQWPQ